MTGSNQGAKHPGADPYSKLSKAQSRRRNTGPLIIGATALVVVVIAVVVFLVTRGDDTTTSASGSAPKVTTVAGVPSGATAAKSAKQETATVEVEGESLPDYPSDVTQPFTDAQDDPAVGKVPPTLTGQTFDGSGITIRPGDGHPMVVMFVAHWCPHCQREVPLVQKWIEDGNLPKDVEVYAVATGTSEDRPNYPPSKWLASVGWQPPVLLDDAQSTAAQAYGLQSYPYFVMTDGSGKVVTRGTGEVTMDQFGQAVDALSSSAGGAASTTTTAG